VAADTTKGTTTTTTTTIMVHLLNHPTVVLDTTNLHTHPTQGRRRCMAILHISHNNTLIMAAMLNNRMLLSINLNLA